MPLPDHPAYEMPRLPSPRIEAALENFVVASTHDLRTAALIPIGGRAKRHFYSRKPAESQRWYFCHGHCLVFKQKTSSAQ